MFGYRFIRTASVALLAYGVLGLLIAASMVIVGTTTFRQIERLQSTLQTQTTALVASIRTVSNTVRDTANSTTDFQKSIDGARTSASDASKLANDTAGTFRDLAAGLNIQIFGLQPLAGLTPQFNRGADQLQQLAISLGTTRDSLAQNRDDVQRVGGDLVRLQGQLDAVATSLSQPGLFGIQMETLLPFQIAFYGMCLLVALQSAFSLVAGVALYRLPQAALLPLKALPSASDGETGLVASRGGV